MSEHEFQPRSGLRRLFRRSFLWKAALAVAVVIGIVGVLYGNEPKIYWASVPDDGQIVYFWR